MPIIKEVVFFTFRDYNIVTFRCPRSYACRRSNFIFLYSYINRHGWDFLTLHHLQVCFNMFNVYSTAGTLAKI